MAALLLAGALIWYRPWLTASTQPVAEVPEPPALFATTQFRLIAHQRACMNSVTVTPQSQLVQFQLFPASAAASGGPPIDLTLDAPGYHTKVAVGGGYPGGSASLPFSPPTQPLIATACFHDLGSTPVLLVGTSEQRTSSRSHLTLNGRAVPGDIALQFLQSQRRDMLQLPGQLVRHASNLTGGLLPPALIWLVAILTAFGVPIAVIMAFRAALREEDLAGATDGAPTGSRPRTARSG
jgi:hypothetical protein